MNPQWGRPSEDLYKSFSRRWLNSCLCELTVQSGSHVAWQWLTLPFIQTFTLLIFKLSKASQQADSHPTTLGCWKWKKEIHSFPPGLGAIRELTLLVSGCLTQAHKNKASSYLPSSLCLPKKDGFQNNQTDGSTVWGDVALHTLESNFQCFTLTQLAVMNWISPPRWRWLQWKTQHGENHILLWQTHSDISPQGLCSSTGRNRCVSFMEVCLDESSSDILDRNAHVCVVCVCVRRMQLCWMDILLNPQRCLPVSLTLLKQEPIVTDNYIVLHFELRITMVTYCT